MHTFTANYSNGTCFGCDEPLVEGEELAYSADDELWHADCLRTGRETVEQPALFDIRSARAARQS